MKKLDLYIIKKFVSTFIFSILVIVSIIIIIDISEKISDFLEKKAPIRAIIVDYYLNFLPYIVVMFTPLFVFIAVLFFTSKMAERSEIVAILAGGVSIKRLMRPYLISASIIAIFNLYLNHFLIPKANFIRLNFEEMYYKNEYVNGNSNIHLQTNDTTFLYMRNFYANENKCLAFTKEIIKKKNLEYKLSANELIWDKKHKNWLAKNVVEHRFLNNKEIITRSYKKNIVLKVNPSDFKKRRNVIETMNYFQLDKFIKKEKFMGKNVEHIYIEKYKRTSMPFACFILTVIGLSLAYKKKKGGIGLQIGYGISLSFAYIFLMQIGATLAINIGLNTLLSVWLPNIIFTFIAFFLFKAVSL